MDVADASRMSFLQQASSENLAMNAKLSVSPDYWGKTNDLYLSIVNTGGVASTIVGVFVSATNGLIASNSTVNPSSHFLSVFDPASGGDLNLSLPLTLGLGTNTSRLSGCQQNGLPGCDIGISQSSFDYLEFVQLHSSSTTVVISVLTSLGNVFSVEYPAPQFITHKNVFVIDPNYLNLLDVDQSLINQFLLSQSGVVGCYECITGLAAGGNILVALITASPSPVQDTNPITVVANVSNYSPYPASGVTVTLSTLYSGSATVSPDGSHSPVPCGTSMSIASQKHTIFTCSFVANSGGSTGTVTFVGTAQGCIDVPGVTTKCSAGTLGTNATSSSASSNPVQVGSVASVGLWQLNYYYFSYTASTSTTPSPASVIPHADHYVAFNVQVTNIYNESMDLLDGSYIQFVSPGSDVDAYIAWHGSVTYPSDTFTAYGCTDGPPGAPTDSVTGESCITVAPGGTVNLVFVASGAGVAGTSTTGWEWGNVNFPGGTTIGNTVDIILEYTLSTPAGVYSLHAENIPFQSVFVS